MSCTFARINNGQLILKKGIKTGRISSDPNKAMLYVTGFRTLGLMEVLVGIFGCSFLLVNMLCLKFTSKLLDLLGQNLLSCKCFKGINILQNFWQNLPHKGRPAERAYMVLMLQTV